MKIVALYGGPRKKGNTLLLLEEVLQAVRQQGAEVEVFNLNTLNFKGCQACFGCKKHEGCVIKDDAQRVLQAIAAADRLVLATPVYMWDLTGQLKLMLDRLFCFLNLDHTSKLTPGKKVLWTITQGQPDTNMFKEVFVKHGKMLEFLGFGENQFVMAGGLMVPGDINKQTAVLAEARAKAQWLVK